jgi:lambda family phage portal protein
VPNFLETSVDYVVNAISPRMGNQRRAARLQREFAEEQWAKAKGRRSLSSGGFQSAEQSRDAHSWMTSRLSPQSALEADRETMLERADSAYKNFELGANHVEGRVIRVVGCGTQIDPDIEAEDGISEQQAEKWNKALRRAWDRQAKRIGKRNEPLWKLQQVMQRHDERHGEWFVLVGDKFDPFSPTTLKIEVIHPNRVETPPEKSADPLCRMGVQLNQNGEVVGYWIRDSHPHDDKDLKHKHTYYPAYLKNGLPRVIHHFDQYEAGMLRGYPRMQVGLKRLKNAEEYGDAELERNYVGACLTAFVKTDLGYSDAVGGLVEDASGNRVRDMSPGQIQYMGEADDVTVSNPSGAPATFEPFMQHQARMFACGAGSSYEIVSNDFRNMSYSTSRVLWNIEDATVAVEHKDQAETLVAIYEHFVNRAITGPVPLVDIDQVAYRDQPWLFTAARVIAPAKASIDPAKEDRNELVLIEAGIRPGSDFVEKKNGMPADKVYAKVAKDRAMRRKLDLEEHMPNMGRDPQPVSDKAPTQAGDTNVESSEANSGVAA